MKCTWINWVVPKSDAVWDLEELEEEHTQNAP